MKRSKRLVVSGEWCRRKSGISTRRRQRGRVWALGAEIAFFTLLPTDEETEEPEEPEEPEMPDDPAGHQRATSV